jgi:hypothetical protein
MPVQARGNRFMHRRGRTDDEEHEAGKDQEADKRCQPADQRSRAPTRQATDEQRQTQRNIQPPVSVCIHGSASPKQFEGTTQFLVPQPSSRQYGDFGNFASAGTRELELSVNPTFGELGQRMAADSGRLFYPALGVYLV